MLSPGTGCPSSTSHLISSIPVRAKLDSNDAFLHRLIRLTVLVKFTNRSMALVWRTVDFILNQINPPAAEINCGREALSSSS